MNNGLSLCVFSSIIKTIEVFGRGGAVKIPKAENKKFFIHQMFMISKKVLKKRFIEKLCEWFDTKYINKPTNYNILL